VEQRNPASAGGARVSPGARRRWWPALLLAVAAWAFAPPPTGADLAGHGGPVRAVAVGPGGRAAVTGGFDHSVMVWDTAAEAPTGRLIAHEAVVNSVRLTRDGSTASR
jgi:cytochrome c